MWNCWNDKYFVNMMEMCICLIRSHWRVSPTYIQDLNLFITVLLDARVLDGTRSLIRSHWIVIHSSTSPTYTQDLNLFITVLLDARVLDGTRSSAVTVFSTKSHIFFMKFHWLPPNNCCCDAVFRRHTTQAQQRQSKKKHKWTELNSVNTLRQRQDGRHFRKWKCVNLD